MLYEPRRMPLSDKILNALAILAVTGFFVTLVVPTAFLGEPSPRDNYTDTIFVGLSFVWAAFALVYHIGIFGNTNMRFIGMLAVFILVVVIYRIGGIAPRTFPWLALWLWALCITLSLLPDRFRPGRWTKNH